MSTKRLYWEIPYETMFEAKVKRAGLKGDRPFLVLDRTLFHPEAGGQPADLGTIELLGDSNEVLRTLGTSTFEVAQVLEDGDEVVHVLSVGEVPGNRGGEYGGDIWPSLEGSTVKGTIDWPFRFDLMQQHTGQHILSRAFEEALIAETVGFHLSRDYGTIDLGIQSVSPEALADVERRANQVVFKNSPVSVKEYEEGELPGDIRSRFSIDAPKIRVVYVGDYDACPCGGTHVSWAGQIGLIKVNQVDRAHGGVRVVFRCGWRALADYGEKESLLHDTARLVSQSPDAVPAAVQLMKDKILDLEKSLQTMKETLLDLEIAAMVREHEGEPSGVLIKCLQGKGIEELRVAAKKVSEGTGSPVVFFAGSPKFQVVVACPAHAPDAKRIVAEIAGVLGGRGGGTPQLAQLGSKEPLDMPEDEAIKTILACLEAKGLR